LHFSSLASVDEVSPQDVWAVGAFVKDPFGVQEPLIVHYDGAAWKFVPSPINNGGLYDVSVIDTSDVWAVGWFVPEVGGAAEDLILHWDGTSWSQVPAPAPGATSDVRRVSSVSADDVWATGEGLDDQGVGRSFIMHWAGASWKIEHVVASGFSLGDIDASSSTDAWAVGGSVTDVLMLHWDGISWHRVPAPDPGDPPDLSSVADISSSDAWVAGTVVRNPFGTTPVLFHWDGVAWTYTEPDRVSNFGTLAAGSPNDVWATGFRNDPLVMHWNGSKWSTVHFQAPGHVWTGMVSDGPDSVWVVGHEGRGGSQLTTKHITIGGSSVLQLGVPRLRSALGPRALQR